MTRRARSSSCGTGRRSGPRRSPWPTPAAGLDSNTNWRKYPRNMLFARAISNGARWYCPDLFGGSPVYTPDELGAEVDGETGEVLGDARIVSEPRLSPDEFARLQELIEETATDITQIQSHYGVPSLLDLSPGAVRRSSQHPRGQAGQTGPLRHDGGSRRRRPVRNRNRGVRRLTNDQVRRGRIPRPCHGLGISRGPGRAATRSSSSRSRSRANTPLTDPGKLKDDCPKLERILYRPLISEATIGWTPERLASIGLHRARLLSRLRPSSPDAFDFAGKIITVRCSHARITRGSGPRAVGRGEERRRRSRVRRA